ncbi:hypothetical protein TTHERM_000535351 (macronuclear) [Tetrahymena thermophila SB210]|uniref:Uncharacterized protein n=1 Tax=Tetrahymena thermophila (strain SB210) TaxID=312017 RepID=W7WZ89_TETTS|nr:hypothetical protein TTHERM_000535351 [Tetrahymena thermophila SB210]EWS72205.1 hypothetical protein TTHERM_000535351 [Tetrahymena thermophila SB210]|eukprot:XP_012655248.1 hypothetical protein TTHERM_000535351 [Tetrahymena thermophila SB210]
MVQMQMENAQRKMKSVPKDIFQINSKRFASLVMFLFAQSALSQSSAKNVLKDSFQIAINPNVSQIKVSNNGKSIINILAQAYSKKVKAIVSKKIFALHLSFKIKINLMDKLAKQLSFSLKIISQEQAKLKLFYLKEQI